jgi:hypothetical protein
MRAGSLTFRPPPVRLVRPARPGCMAPASGANSPSSPCVAAAMHPHLSTVLYSQEVLATRTRELGAELSKEYAHSAPLVLQVRGKPQTCCLPGHVAPRRALQGARCAASRLCRRVATPPRGGARAAGRGGRWLAGPGPQPPRGRGFSLRAPFPRDPARPTPHARLRRAAPTAHHPGAGTLALCLPQHRSPHALPAHDTPALTAADSAAPGSLRR